MKTENRKTLRGSVLFTVICVMALLIIFLTGTLALASASSNRAHKSYASSQASYTARAAIDAFVQSMERNEGIPAAIENMGSDPLEVEMKINDRTLGVIGSYDGSTWKEGIIRIDPVADSTGYIYTDLDGQGMKWVPVTAVKVTATCRVGKEEETVTAYIRKTAATHSQQAPGGLDGLQEVGGNAFPNGALITGGLGLGISKDASGLYRAHNNTVIETKSTFINGDFAGGTGSFAINIQNPVSENGVKLMPNSKTVIMGSVCLSNTDFINLDYEMTADYTQKDIPYLYVDKTIAGMNDGAAIGRVVNRNPDTGAITSTANGKGKAPFNLFVGTLSSYSFKNNLNIGGADVYLLDEYTPSKSYTVYNCKRSYSKEELANTDVGTDSEIWVDCDGITVGDNYIGKPEKNTVLYNWESSYVHKTDSQFKTTGGNLYSMGRLTLENCEINGNVGVHDDCIIKSNVTIKGDLVVEGTLSFEDGGKPTSVGGKIYCDVIKGVSNAAKENVVKEGFIEHVNELVPGYAEIPNAIYDNTPLEGVEECEVAQDPASNYQLAYDYAGKHVVIDWSSNDANIAKDAINNNGGILYVSDTGIYSKKPYNPTTYDGNVDKTKVVTTDKIAYKVDPNDTDVIRDEVAEGDFTYYRRKDDGTVDAANEVPKDVAVKTYYTKEGDPNTVYGASQACDEVDTTIYPAYTGSGKEPAYPTNMTRKAIYGYEDPDSHEFIEADPKTKLIKNVYEVRQELNMDKNGDYDPKIYHDHVPKKFCLNADDDTFIDEPDDPLYNSTENVAQRNKLPYAYGTDGKPVDDNTIWQGGEIISSCIIGDPDGKNFTPPKGDVKIKGSGDGIWIILRNVVTADDSGVNFLCDTSEGKVCFLIDGTLTISKTDIRPTVTKVSANGGYSVQEFKAGCTVTPQSSWGIEYYGTEGSKIVLSPNESTLVGTFMCPNTTFKSEVQGKTSCKYIDEYGVERTISSPIVGSALFNKIEGAKNEFSVLNSGGAGAKTNTSSVHTALGTYEISYFAGA